MVVLVIPYRFKVLGTPHEFIAMFTNRFTMQMATRLKVLYIDRNHDGKITDADRYRYKERQPDVTFGISTTEIQNNGLFGYRSRASVGNYM